MSEQLTLLREHPPAPKKKARGKPETCKCGDLRSEHKEGKGKCLACAERRVRAEIEMGPLARFAVKVCCKFKSTKRAPKPVPEDLQAPAGSITLLRPTKEESELDGMVHPTEMGWAAFDGDVLTVYLANFKPKTPNENRFTRWRAKRAIEGRERDRTRHALKTAMASLAVPSDRPMRITLTRVCPGTPDSDNVAASWKHCIDGLKVAIGVDDKHFSIGGEDPSKVALISAQQQSGQPGIYGVFIELGWT